MKNERVYNVVEVFYRKAGKKRSILCMNRTEANRRLANLLSQKRKFLGAREVTLVEVAN